MGSYATTSSLAQLLPNAMSGNTTSADSEAVATFGKHIERAEGDINTVLAERYTLPFTTVPPSVRSWSEDLACFYFLRAAISQDGRIGDSSARMFVDSYDRLQAAREKGFKGTLTLTDGSVLSPITTGRFKSSTENEGPVFDLDTATSWKADSDRLDRAGDARD